MRKYVAEAVGTFCLVFAGTGAVIVDNVTAGGVSHVGVALTFGLVVMAMIYAIGDVSGAHLNPAVTLGFFLAGRLRGRCIGPYVLAQLCGGLIASAALLLIFGNRAGLGGTFPAGGPWQSFTLEIILTAILMFVALCVSTGSKEVGTMAGIAVGGVVALEALFAGPISGASMNPVRSLAPALVSGQLDHVWIYLTAPFAGALVAVLLWRIIYQQDPAESVNHVTIHKS